MLIFTNDYFVFSAEDNYLQFGLIRLNLPTFKVCGVTVQGDFLRRADANKIRDLASGGEEWHLRYIPTGLLGGLTLTVQLRVFDNSPFARLRYVLQGEGLWLDKDNRRDSLTYLGFELEGFNNSITEIQLGQFDELTHAYLPHAEDRSEANYMDTLSFAGPIVQINGANNEILCGYEHGSECPDTFINFRTHRRKSGVLMEVSAVQGNYYQGQRIDTPFITPWLHIGVTSEPILPHYRDFFLHYISENNESRRPYIYYNTWNNQERNKARGQKYLDGFTLDRILAEIDIAHRMGVDVFVLDTGWYEKTGDWIVNEKRFPDGMRTVKQRLDEYGMKLGLWFNPTVAAKTSQIYQRNKHCVKAYGGKKSGCAPVWETEESFGMCLVSDYTEHYIQSLISLCRELGVSYFKWDAIHMHGCDSAEHHHGTEENTPEERDLCYSFRLGMQLIHIVEEVCRECPEAIFDLDVTESGRFMGLGFLAVGKFFHMNNGPYYMNFDIPDASKRFKENVNVFFHPGLARSRVCRQFIKYDSIIPSILFLAHFLPEKPRESQMASLASLVLGGNGIWGDLLALEDDDIAIIEKTLRKYKQVRDAVTAAYPRIKGFNGSSPEIHEKIDYNQGAGIIVFFTRRPVEIQYITDPLPEGEYTIDGADSHETIDGGRKIIQLSLAQGESRIVFIKGNKN